MKIKRIKTGQERTITKEAWQKIVGNGFAGEYQIIEDAPMPKEVAERMNKDTKATN